MKRDGVFFVSAAAIVAYFLGVARCSAEDTGPPTDRLSADYLAVKVHNTMNAVCLCVM